MKVERTCIACAFFVVVYSLKILWNNRFTLHTRTRRNMSTQDKNTSRGDEIDVLLDPETLLMEEEDQTEASTSRQQDATPTPQPRWVDEIEVEELRRAAAILRSTQPSLGHIATPIQMDVQPRSRASTHGKSDITNSDDKREQFVAILEDAEEYAKSLKRKLERPHVPQYEINALSNENNAIEATIKDLEYVPRGLARQTLRRARQVKWKLLVLQSTIKSNTQQHQLQQPQFVPEVRENADERRRQEEQARWDARALELAQELRDALCKAANTRKVLTTSQKKVRELSALVHEDLGIQVAEFIHQYLPDAKKATKRECSLPPPPPAAAEQHTPARGERGQPGMVTDADGMVWVQLPSGRCIPASTVRTAETPNTPCIFCKGDHHAHLYCKKNTLESQRAHYQRYRLCTLCTQSHPDTQYCKALPPANCRWFCCGSSEHHSNLCLVIDYPITESKVMAWIEMLCDCKQYLPRDDCSFRGRHQ